MPEKPIPRRMPISAPRVASGDITIRNSGSTNTAGYTILLRPDGSAAVTLGGETSEKTVPMAQTKWLFEKVRGAMPLDALPASGCMKSASFGTAVSVSYDGRTSPDVSCARDPATREIARTIGVIVSDLGISTLPRRHPNP